MAKPLKKVSNAYWVYYVNEAEAKKFDDSKVGKWMYFFKDNDFAAKICEKAVVDGVVAEAKHSNAPDGVCCFYLHFDDKEAHKSCITYFLENGLIRKTKLRLESYTISRLSSMVRHETANMATVLYLRSNSLIL